MTIKSINKTTNIIYSFLVSPLAASMGAVRCLLMKMALWAIKIIKIDIINMIILASRLGLFGDDLAEKVMYLKKEYITTKLHTPIAKMIFSL